MRRLGLSWVLLVLILSACGSHGESNTDAPGPTSTISTPTGSPLPSSPGSTSPTAPSPAATATVTPPASPSGTSTSTPSVKVGTATVDVGVATLWRSPSSPRPVDAPALANPARTRQWLDAMTPDQRRALSGRADTQVLLGDRVHVVAVSGTWARVVVPDQPTPLDPRGYPGWVPTTQLVVDTAAPAGTTVTVTARTTWVRALDGRRLIEVSFGTTLQALALSGDDWQVRLPDGRRAEIVASSVITGSLPTTARAVVSTAREFLGLDYLWAGASGFGFDCSGLTEAVYRLHDNVIPRDADAQATAGRPVARSAVQPGDLVFFARDGHVHHVGMYVGSGMMLHAPRTGTRVQVTSLSVAPYVEEYSGARRFLP